MTLKEAFRPYFKIGSAISRRNLHIPADRKLLLAQFSSFTCENDMKPMFFLDEKKNRSDPETYDLCPALTFEFAKPYLEFARANGIAMRGHTLAWHNQTPKWFFHVRYDETAPLADRETMLARLEHYIQGVLTFVQDNYPGIIYAWDVVNEAIENGGFRDTLWHQTVGFDFVEMAFTFARRYASPDVALFYNDYNTAQPWKRDLILKNILEPLKAKGLIDGFGMQSHLTMTEPDLKDYETALEMYGALGLQIQITELDIHNPDASEASQKLLAERYRALFSLYVEAKKNGKANITSVTFWNLYDECSWLTMFRHQTSYPLVFTKTGEAKEAYYAVLETVMDRGNIPLWIPDTDPKDLEPEAYAETPIRPLH